MSTLTSASNPVSAPNPNPTASGLGSGSSHLHTNGSAAAGGALYPAAPAAPSASAHSPGNASQGAHFHTAYAQAPANAPAPPFPASSATAGFPDDLSGDHDNSGADPKKARACEACRGLKVRCEPVAEDPDGACKRCAKAGRNCIITQPTRKRQKKTDSRVAELEKKIDALTATLSATKAGQAGASLPAHPEAAPGYYGAPGTVTLAGQKRRYTEPAENGGDASAASRSHEHPDLVDRGIITINKAAELLDRYNYRMAPHLPGVVFPHNLTVDELRKTRPVLFLAIMAATSSGTPEIQRVAVRELMQTFADRIVIIGEKSIELVQALTVAVMWYWPPDHLEDLKFYQLVHMAMIMAIDLGLGKRRPRGTKPTLSFERELDKHKTQVPVELMQRIIA
ncbi:putative fungal specific transcription [Diaporthe ampelina]|uniref:Putative fungal specific transcription n=1 Tax=Diaporthe ampelina TaxID=1214573 RepID=A0A0G2FJ82_9PEZI|nr:putative fungal specific transcription [Diaporthe ampelina]